MELNESRVRAMVAAFLAEDVGRGDVTTDAVVPAGLRGRARIEARAEGVIAGLQPARVAFGLAADGDIEWDPAVTEGGRALPGDRIATVDGPLRALLTAERTALNLLQRLSGIATVTARFVAAVRDTPVRILDTRKTTPGLRLLEKAAVRAGGGTNHRFGLDDGVLIKDNHVVAAGGVERAVRAAREKAAAGFRIEVEASDLDQLDEALSAGADAVLLDNMPVELVREAVRRAGGKVILEASGGMSPESVRAYAQAGVDFVSVGALTHSAPALDIAMEVEQTW
jgi:nicotinate-nucleotide pyrophosphorylase (carboxylating)